MSQAETPFGWEMSLSNLLGELDPLKLSERRLYLWPMVMDSMEPGQVCKRTHSYSPHYNILFFFASGPIRFFEFSRSKNLRHGFYRSQRGRRWVLEVGLREKVEEWKFEKSFLQPPPTFWKFLGKLMRLLLAMPPTCVHINSRRPKCFLEPNPYFARGGGVKNLRWLEE